MNCRACGSPKARVHDCCADNPVFCDVCKDLHDRRVHPEPDDFDDEEDWDEDWEAEEEDDD